MLARRLAGASAATAGRVGRRHRCLADASAAVPAAAPLGSLPTCAPPASASAAIASPSSSAAGALARHEAPGSPALAAERAGVKGIDYRGPLEEDVEGGARHASVVSSMWSNVPNHVRASFKAPASIDDAPKASVPQLLDSAISQAKALAATTGFAPASWSPGSAVYYDGALPLAPYRRGQTAAYNYPRVLVPRSMALRVPLDMYVDPVYQTSDPNHKARAKAHTLFPRLQGKATLMICFSGQPLSGLFTGVQRWLDVVSEDFLERKNSQIFKLHAEEGWFNRRTSVLTKFHLRRQVKEDELFTTFVYRGKWNWDMARALHLYDKELPVVLLIDALGYVRWHAVGLPSDDATAVFQATARRLATERKNFV